MCEVEVEVEGSVKWGDFEQEGNRIWGKGEIEPRKRTSFL